MLALTALVAAALFTGAAAYVGWAEHPARLRLDDKAALAQWKPSCARATPMQALLAIASAAACLAAWWRWRSNWYWLGGGVLMLAIVAFTLLVIWRVNQALKAIAPDAAGPESRALLVRWGQLHWVRTALGALATELIWYGLAGPGD